MTEYAFTVPEGVDEIEFEIPKGCPLDTIECRPLDNFMVGYGYYARFDDPDTGFVLRTNEKYSQPLYYFDTREDRDKDVLVFFAHDRSPKPGMTVLVTFQPPKSGVL